MMKMGIDGSNIAGYYRVDCECGTSWQGQTERFVKANWSPALPVAECVVHMKLEHSGHQLHIAFSEQFREWLVHYWEIANLEIATGIMSATHRL